MSSPLSGFTAVPNPQMLAFMGAQSFIMMYQAGEGWQYGKRKISAMSNDDFNRLTPERLLQNQAATLRNSLETIKKSMNDMTPMIRTIIQQYGDFLKEIIDVAPATALNVTGGQSPTQIIQNFQTSPDHHGETILSETGQERQLLADFLKFLGNPFPEAGGHTEVTTTTTVSGDGGSRVIGPTENIPTSGASKIHPPALGLQGSKSFFGGPAPISKPSDRPFQPTGGSVAGRLQNELFQLQKLYASNQNRINSLQRTGISRYSTNKAQYQLLLDLQASQTRHQSKIVSLKAQIGRLNVRRY